MRFGFGEEEEPEEIITQMQNDVELFVKRIPEDGQAVTFLEGRKASFLVQHMKPRLEEWGFAVQMLRYNRIDGSFFHGPLDTTNPTIVITDSIHSGEKMVRSLDYLRNAKVRIRNVYSYLSTEKGVKRVLGSGLIQNDNIYSHHCAHNEEEYRKFSGKLSTYFNSRIEPMETETPYDLYTVNGSPPKKSMIALFRRGLNQATGSKVIMMSAHNKRLPRSVWKVGFNIRKDAVGNLFGRIPRKSMQDFNLRYMHVHFKVRRRNKSLDFTMIPEVDLVSAAVRVDNRIRCPITEGDLCPILGIDGRDERVLVCASCLGNILSIALMTEFETEILSVFSEEQIQCWRKHREFPLEQKIRLLLNSDFTNAQEDRGLH